MARRMSNRERIQRQALEAAAREEEREAKKAAEADAPKSKSKAKTAKTAKKKTTRLKMVWIVFDQRMNEVATFPYSEKEAAEAEAAALTEKSGEEHFVNPIKVPME